jgi:hypothetical protein
MELIFQVRDAEEGGFCARALGHAVFTEADTWEELRTNAVEAASLHFEDCAIRPRIVQLRYAKDGNHTIPPPTLRFLRMVNDTLGSFCRISEKMRSRPQHASTPSP